ncbi:hypothetical protein F4777DRAFT_568187, partial [Nemania sp. FL0916]
MPTDYSDQGATAYARSSTAFGVTTYEVTSGTKASASRHPLSALDRDFAKPLQELDIAYQLSKRPTYWSVRGWIERSAYSSVQPVVEDPDMRTRRFEEVKRSLLASASRL